jgi:segregation and condensation protein B
MTDYVARLHDVQSEASKEQADRSPPLLVRIIEALLFAGKQPLTAQAACSIIRDLTPELFHSSIDELTRQYRNQARPYIVQQRDKGFVLSLKPAYQSLRERIFGGPREVRLSVVALEVLAVVAYKQPVTRKEIDALRGIDSATTLRQLVRLGLIAVERPIPGTAEPTYGTSPRFLEVFGLKSIDDLPKTADLQRI